MRNGKHTFQGLWLIYIFLILFLLVTGTVVIGSEDYNDDHGHANNPFEPTVTREESILLNRAMEMASSNSVLAIEMLQIKDLEHASPALDFAIGNLYFQREQLDKAADAYLAAIKKQSRFRSAIMNLGRVYLLQERTQDAIELYQQLVTDGQADADILVLLGHALLMENAPVSAESAYRQSLLLRPKHADAMLGMAKTLMQQERYAEGLALVGEILNRDPINEELWSLRANAYLSMGKHAEAVRTIEKARRLGCADGEMLATLGDLLLNRDQPEDALRAYELAFRKNTPTIPRVLRAIEGFLMIRDVNGAETMIARADEMSNAKHDQFSSTQKTTFLRLKAEFAQQMEHFSDAMNLCSEVLLLDPLDGRTMLLLAELQLGAGHLEDAVMTCERAARVKGYEADALVRQAQIEVQRERYSRAASLLEAAQTFKDRPHVACYLDQIRRMAD
jgi:tetratricopeptide (TPR) repeat protein